MFNKPPVPEMELLLIEPRESKIFKSLELYGSVPIIKGSKMLFFLFDGRPVLGSILTLAAVETSIAQGVILLSFYSLGLAVPFILSGYGITKFLSVSKNLKSKMRLISLIGGSILLITGILILTNVLQIVGFYLLEIFPFLENFG